MEVASFLKLGWQVVFLWMDQGEIRLVFFNMFASIRHAGLASESSCSLQNYNSPKNHGSRKWLYLKGNYYWRDPFFIEP